MRILVAAALVVVVLTGCSSSGPSKSSVSTTTQKLTPGFEYTDCSKIKAGDDLTVQAAALLCQPDNHAEFSTPDS